MYIKEYDPNQFIELKEYWLQLENGKDMTAFQHYGWFENINNLYFKEHIKKLFRFWKYFIVFNDDGQPLLIAPIQVVKVGLFFKNIGLKKGAYFIGRQGYSDYLNFIYDDFSDEAVDFLFEYLLKEYKIKNCFFEQILEETQMYQYLVNKYKYTQIRVACAALVLPEIFDDYKALLSKSTRQNIRTAINRQNRDGLTFTHEISFDVDDALKEELLSVREERLGKKQKAAIHKSSIYGKLNLLGNNIIKKLFCAKHNVMNECYNPWCFLIKNGDEIAGYFWGIADSHKKVYYVILAGVREKYAWYSPSVSHLYLFLQEQYEAGNKDIIALDFTRGGERYKADMGGKIKNCWSVRFKL